MSEQENYRIPQWRRERHGSEPYTEEWLGTKKVLCSPHSLQKHRCIKEATVVSCMLFLPQGWIKTQTALLPTCTMILKPQETSLLLSSKWFCFWPFLNQMHYSIIWIIFEKLQNKCEL